ncbi:pectin lyase fold/virulence factor [Pyrenochaeta sp. DS3sAY3a]|nr:pectin lyase fold/virulence factor [Pyrenochaeta sp. DS3sAY3a]
MNFASFSVLLWIVAQWDVVKASWEYANPQRYPQVPVYGPQDGPSYMVDNQYNYYKAAPDKGKNGPVWNYSGSLENYISNLKNNTVVRGSSSEWNGTRTTRFTRKNDETLRIAANNYWLAKLAPLGAVATTGWQRLPVFPGRNSLWADSSGKTDASEAINAAVSSWNLENAKNRDRTRCGKECGNTFTQGAIIYFPRGTYKLCSPVIQLYYTQFIGDANDPPTIKGCDKFQGIALFDTDPYIPGGSGSQWYVNQNQFFRQIRNFIFDLKDMPRSTQENDQPLVPTGIHWQVAQATSLQNLVFNMPVSRGSNADNATTAVGIFTENGSGGFVSNLTFNGGNIGWRVGSQQFTARNLKFKDCLTAVQMIWDWGFHWQGIEVSGGAIGFNISGVGGTRGQGTASISLVDSSVSNVPVGILTNQRNTSPNIVLDNTIFKNVERIVQVDGGATPLTGPAGLWATGKRYNGSVGSMQTGPVTAPAKAKALLDSNGKLFVRSRPQYESVDASGFLVATTDGGCKNDATGDQTTCINAFLQKAKGKIAYFPAGIYAIGGTVFIPTGSKVQGSSWSQIQGAGYFFGDMQAPKVMVQVGNKGDVGSLEIVDMLFSVRGPTAGAILMEWNVAAAERGAAGMWDSHFRVGGGIGTDLDLAHCPKFSENEHCIAASLIFHVTKQASGYFENVWAWLADHDNDASIFKRPDSSNTQISIFCARGVLIESQGPSWFYGGGSEHSVLYNYLLSGAKAVFMGHIQTESPYFQPVPAAPSDNEQCRYAWGLRIVDSADVTIHSAGLYSFFNAYYQDCIETQNCQQHILEVTGSTGVVIFNLFTVATVQIANGIDGSRVLQADFNQRGFTTEVSVWIPLPGKDNANVVYVGPEIFSNPSVSCSAPCVLVFPTSHLQSPTTISPVEYVTSLEYGTYRTTSTNGAPATVFVTSTTIITIAIPPIVVTGMPFSNIKITSSGPTSIVIYPSVDVPRVTIPVPDGKGSTTSRVVSLPPWPSLNQGPGGTGVNTDPGTESNTNTGSLTSSTTYYTGITSTVTASGPTATRVTFPPSTVPFTIKCPNETGIEFSTPFITVTTRCTDSAARVFNFVCPTTKSLYFLGPTTARVSVDCIFTTAWSTGKDSSTTTPLPMWTTWPGFGWIEPVTTTPNAPEPTDDGVKVPCKAWFFSICISWGKIHVGGWYLRLPPGIYGPGPPPVDLIKWPPGFTLRGTLPPWPRITIREDHQIKTDEQPECKTKTAEACTFSTIFFVTTTTSGVRTTTGTSTSSHCETISGCSVRGSDQTTTSTTVKFGTQTLAPVGTFYDEGWFSDLGEAYSSSVFSALFARLAAEEASADGSVISFTPVGAPPGFHDPKDPSSEGHSASTTRIGGSTPVVSTPQATPTAKPKTPLARGDIKCHNEADFPGHADIQSGDQDRFSTAFSNLRSHMGGDDSLGPQNGTVRLVRTDSHGVNYDFSCGWVPGCVTEVEKQSFGFPLGSPSMITAYLLVREDYTKCNNGGVGGSCQVGCLLYTFDGGKGDTPPDTCKSFDCRGCGSPFDLVECQTCCKGLFINLASAGNDSTNIGFSIVDNMVLGGSLSVG